MVLRKFELTIIFLFILIILFVTIFFITVSQGPIIELDSGAVQGKTVNGIKSYLGIPYAKPPINELRWKPPQEPVPWYGTKKTTEFGAACSQPQLFSSSSNEKMSEDCLYINVWTSAKNKNENLPVMVWIYGGAFLVGEAGLDPYHGANLASEGVVVVTFNYRLGSLGFLAHPDLSQESLENTSGNYGYMDQIEALRWVQRNIKQFGGDPNKVTIFGESAGSISVTSLMVSPLTKGLFQRVIAQSGTPVINKYVFLNSTGPITKAYEMGEKLEKAIGCDQVEDILFCLRNKTPEELILASNSGIGISIKGLEFSPVIDGYVIPEDPVNLFLEGKIQDVPLMIGTNANEGTIFVLDEGIMPDGSVIGNNEKNDESQAIRKYEYWVQEVFGENSSQILEQFPTTKENIFSTFSEIYTLTLFAQPAHLIAQSTAVKNPNVYLYQFNHVPPAAESNILGACHGCEIPYVFGNLNQEEYSETDFELSEKMMNYWTNFAKTGNPNSEGLEEWPIYTGSEKEYLEFN
ncbi:MAG: carboxylesterase/lipase family protein [archaeon]|nr:carboxylesterase family protein [Nanoarchaeota archaeon]